MRWQFGVLKLQFWCNGVRVNLSPCSLLKRLRFSKFGKSQHFIFGEFCSFYGFWFKKLQRYFQWSHDLFIFLHSICYCQSVWIFLDTCWCWMLWFCSLQAQNCGKLGQCNIAIALDIHGCFVYWIKYFQTGELAW